MKVNIEHLMNFVQRWRRSKTSIKLYKVNQTSHFENELKSIYMYLKFKIKEPNIANKFVKKVLKTLYSLEYLPERYARISTFNNNRNLRRIFIDNYLIVYEVLNKTR